MYGSSLISVTRRPRASSRQPIEDAARPLPKLETTPPVTKIYLGIVHSSNCPTNFSLSLCMFVDQRQTKVCRTSFTFSLHPRPLPADRPAPLRRRKAHGSDPAEPLQLSLRWDPETAANP